MWFKINKSTFVLMSYYYYCTSVLAKIMVSIIIKCPVIICHVLNHPFDLSSYHRNGINCLVTKEPNR